MKKPSPHLCRLLPCGSTGHREGGLDSQTLPPRSSCDQRPCRKGACSQGGKGKGVSAPILGLTPVCLPPSWLSQKWGCTQGTSSRCLEKTIGLWSTATTDKAGVDPNSHALLAIQVFQRDPLLISYCICQSVAAMFYPRSGRIAVAGHKLQAAGLQTNPGLWVLAGSRSTCLQASMELPCSSRVAQSPQASLQAQPSQYTHVGPALLYWACTGDHWCIRQ